MKHYYVLLLGVLLFACKKDCIVSPPSPPYKKCIVQYMTIAGPFPDTLDFYYYDWGGPEKIISRLQNNSVSMDYYFVYDTLHRITDLLIGRYGRENFTMRTIHYIYQGERVTSDSLDFPSPPIGAYNLGTYEYDADGKITKYTFSDQDNHVFSSFYLYETGDPTFQNRNVFSGNPVLMFVNKDYSRSGVGEIYNEYGYPVVFPDRINGAVSQGYTFVQTTFQTASYLCIP